MAEYAELHCHSNFSFLDGASHPEELVEEAHRLGLSGLAVTDHDGLYGVVRLAVAARPLGLPTVFGAELTLEVEQPPVGRADPPGEHLVIIGEGPAGYAGLARAITEGQMRGEKGAPKHTLARLADAPPRGSLGLVGAHRVSEGLGARRARARRSGRGGARTGPAHRCLRSGSGSHRALGPR